MDGLRRPGRTLWEPLPPSLPLPLALSLLWAAPALAGMGAWAGRQAPCRALENAGGWVRRCVWPMQQQGRAGRDARSATSVVARISRGRWGCSRCIVNCSNRVGGKGGRERKEGTEARRTWRRRGGEDEVVDECRCCHDSNNIAGISPLLLAHLFTADQPVSSISKGREAAGEQRSGAARPGHRSRAPCSVVFPVLLLLRLTSAHRWSPCGSSSSRPCIAKASEGRCR